MSNDIAPFLMSEHAGSFSLLLVDFDSGAAVFEAKGYECGGYAWHGVADSLMRLRAPHLLDRIQFDPEGSMFAAHGPDRDALEELGRVLKAALDDHDLLRTAIENADPELML